MGVTVVAVPDLAGLSELVARAPGEPDWRAALCAQTDPEVFFPDPGGSTRDAKRICARCPIRVGCLRWALETRQAHGVWGGLSERERRGLRRGDLAA
jgi:WhiB family redox-sensing transcriptional regulator